MDWEVRAALVLLLGILLATIQHGIAERKIVCYYTNWSVYRPGTAKFSPQNINPYLCTHLIYAFGGFTKDNALKPFDKYQDIEKGGYAKFTGLKTYNKNLKTMLAIGGWNEGSSRFSPMVADPARRREFVKNAVKFLRQNHFDGLDLDWEYPAFRDGGKPRDKDNYANLVQELREEFEREASKTGRPRLLLSMAMPAGIEYIDKGYDMPRLNQYLDFINLLSYDYHSAYEPAVNHHSPLYPLEEDNEYNYDAELTIDYTISHLMEKGASANKIVLGIPTYGRSYTLFNKDATELGSPADGPGVEGDATREKGYLAYYEICEGIAESDEWEVVQPNPNAMGPYAFKADQWVGYDDEDIVKLKARYVNEKKLGGIMFWSIDNDDFRGKCHGRPYPLIEAAKEALLTDNSKNTIDKTKSVDSRKKTRIQTNQSNSVARKLGSSSRRSTTTTAPSTARKRVSSQRTKYRTISRSKASDEEQEDREVSRRSYEPSPDEDIEAKNTVRVTEKIERPKNRSRSKTRSGSADRSSRRKQSRRKGQTKTDDGESLSNKLTTPEPPTTPDPGTDFKCEDEGFFPHPRDCKKYFWCLDSGPSGLGVVAHQFTCPSGLVFNKAADSCDYPRNVICPKSKTSVVSTTRSPITAATSRTTYLHSTTTPKAEAEEEEYDSEEDYDEDEIEENEEEEEPKTTTTTAKPLVYKTLTRSRPSTTTTTTLRPSEPEKAIDSEDEEDPRVIKELIDLIKKAGGIEHLEKQLLLQEKNSDTTSGSANVTPATISRSLYERVLSRQANKIASQRPVLSSSQTSYVNGPGRAQFEGLDDIPEVKSLRRSQKPQYVTIERPKSNKKGNEDNDEDEEDDNAEIAFSEEQSVNNPLDSGSSTQRVTPNYVNIRRARPSTTTSRNENDVGEREVDIEEDQPTRRRRPFFSHKQQDNEANSETSKPFRNRSSVFRNSEKDDDSEDADRSVEKDDGSSTTKSRYVSIQRFRSTTSKTSKDSGSAIPPLSEPTIETTSATRVLEYPETSTPASPTSTTSTPTTSTSTEVITVISVEPSDYPSSIGPVFNASAISSTTEPVKLVEDSATEILLTTVPASSASQLTTTTTASRSTIAAVSQPRPFGFTRRKSGGSSDTATTTTTPSSNQVRPKVADSEAIRLPTLKELIGYPTTYDYTVTAPSSVFSHLPRFDVDNDISRQAVEESELGGTNDPLDPPSELASERARELIEESSDSWLRQASESKVRSRAAQSKDDPEERASATSAIRKDENKPEQPSTAMYLKPTTMRGLPLASLTPSSVTRGFYVTKNDNEPSSSTWTESFASSYAPIEQQTETTPILGVPTVARNDQSEVESSTIDDRANNIISNENENAREAKFTTFGFSTVSSEDSNSVENTADYEELEVTMNPVDGAALKRGKSLRGFGRDATSLPDAPVISPTTPTRRAIALAISKYNELTTPLWTGKRIVTKKRIRTTISPIKDAIRRTEDSFLRSTASVFRGDSVTTQRLPVRSRTTTEATMTLTTDSSVAESDPWIVSTSDDLVGELTSKVTENPATLTTPASTDVMDDSTATGSTITTTFAEDETTFANANYAMAAADSTAIASDSTTITADKTFASTITDYHTLTMSTKASTQAMEADSASTGLESTISTIADRSATTDTPAIGITDPLITTYTPAIESVPTNHPTTTIPQTTSMHEIASDSEPGTTIETASTEAEDISTVASYSANTIPMTVEEEHSTKTVPETSTSWTVPPTEIVSVTAPIFAGANYANAISTTIQEEHSTTTIPETITRITPTEIVNTTTFISTVANYSANTIPTTIQEEYSTTIAPETTAWITPNEVASAAAPTTDTDSMTTMTDATVTTEFAAAIIPVTTDLANTATASVSASVASTVTFVTNADNSWTTTDSESSSETSSELPVTNAEPISTEPTIAMTSTTESSTISLTAPMARDVDVDVEVPSVTETKQSAHTTEILMTHETSPKSTVTTTSIPKSLADTDSGTSTATTASFTQVETTATNRASSTLVPIESTVLSSIPATSRESLVTNVTLGTTTRNTYETSSVRTMREEPIRPGLKTVSEETAARPAQNRTRGRTRSELAAIGHEFGRRTSERIVVHRRVINRPSNGDVETPTTRRPTRQYPRRRVTVYRGQPQRPIYTPSWRVIQENRRRRVVQKRLRSGSEATNDTVRSDENVVDVRNSVRENVSHDRVEDVRRRTKVVLKRVIEKVEKKETSTSPAAETPVVLGESSNLTKDAAIRAYREDTKAGRRRKIVLKRIKSQPDGNFDEEASGDISSPDISSSRGSQSVLRTSGNLDEAEKMRKKTRVVLKRLKSAEMNSTTRRVRVDPNFSEENISHTLPTNLRAGNSFPDEENTRRRMRVVLKRIKPVSKERNAAEETNADQDITNENLQGDFSSGTRTGKSHFGERTNRRMRVVLKSVRLKPETGNAASEDPDSTDDDLQGNFSSNLYVSDNLPDGEEKTTRSVPAEEEATTSEQPVEPRTTEAPSVRVEEDTDRPSHEVNTWTIDSSASVSRKSAIGRTTRQRITMTTRSTAATPAASTLSTASTAQRRSRPFAESTLSSRMDVVGPYEFTEQSYVKAAGVEVDQRADVSDQSTRAQEFAVTVADPPSSSSSDTGRAQLRDAVRRKISTTIAPRTDSTPVSRTVSRYNSVSRSRQGSKAKDRPTVNATTRPRRPPVVDYDYYEDEVPIVVGKALLNSKLFLTSKGTIRCLDQGNFPHPYSCKKFITCARMVNGQVIGTEYTCPAKLSFDPVGGICNWSAGLGCKD
ncbi:mucin-5AC [Odontomachus brunneus]|uniref:mucin-5AC n=1 Tax=Odontomachus brunneus TaxID=486640 RepID=UPI0013F288CE|nr:mucin-5AC [Odontomachus brunneus]